MVVDSSALLSVLLKEPDAAGFAGVIIDNPCVISAPNYAEAAMVADRHPEPEFGPALDILIETLGIEIVAFEPAHVRAARAAFAEFGEGRHRAALNFGDCCSYALAKARGESLLFKGGDFALTDIAAAG